jgi:ribosomal protein L12E/L44/L45/RPP1/RPP2
VVQLRVDVYLSRHLTPVEGAQLALLVRLDGKRLRGLLAKSIPAAAAAAAAAEAAGGERHTAPAVLLYKTAGNQHAG